MQIFRKPHGLAIMNLFGQKVTIRQTDGHGVNANLVCRGNNYSMFSILKNHFYRISHDYAITVVE